MAYVGQQSNYDTSAFGELSTAQPTGETQLQFPYNLNPEIVSVSTASSGTVISSPPFAVLSTGLSATGSASFQSDDNSHYRAGEGVNVLFTAIFTSGTAGSQQYVGLGNAQNGFFFGYNGASFGILYRQATYGITVTQVTVTNTWILQSSWNQDPFDGSGMSGITLDPTKGNVYKIQMQWLGFGDINFYVENPITGQFTFVHKILYPNLNTNTSVSNASLPLFATVSNSTNTKNMTLKVPSMAMFIEGQIFQNDILFSQSGVSGQQVPTNLSSLLAITNVSTFNNILNGKLVVLSSLSINCITAGTRTISFYLIMNPIATFGFVDVSTGNSCVKYDGNINKTVSGGRTLFTFYFNRNSQENIDLTEYNIYLNPGDVLIVGAQAGQGTSNQQATTTLTWIERY